MNALEQSLLLFIGSGDSIWRSFLEWSHCVTGAFRGGMDIRMKDMDNWLEIKGGGIHLLG